MITHETVTPGFYRWARKADDEPEVVKVVEDAAGLHIKTFDGAFTECLYGDFHARVDL